MKGVNRLFSLLFVSWLMLWAAPALAGVNQWSSNGPYGADTRAIAIDPAYPTTLYAGFNSGGIFKSTNGGESWFSLTGSVVEAAPQMYGVFTIAIDPNLSTTLYAGTYNGGVLKSTNGGTNWQQVNNGLTDLFVNTIAIDPTNANTLFAGTEFGVFKSIDGGANWHPSNTGLPTVPNTFVNSVIVDAKNPGTLYLGTYSGVFKSTNGGDSWTVINTGLANVATAQLAIDPKNSSVLYAGSGAGVFKSNNGGATWGAVNTGLPICHDYINATSLAVDPFDSATVYTQINCGLYKSSDGGASWSQLDANNHINLVVMDPATPATLYRGSYADGIYKSTDSGNSWSLKSTGIASTIITSLVLDPFTPATLYAGDDGAGVFKSSDGGESWSNFSNGLTDKSILCLAIDHSTSGTLYAGNGAGVFKSSNGGADWSLVGNFLHSETVDFVRALAIDPLNQKSVYAATDFGIFKSINSGGSWNQVSVDLPDVEIRTLLVDPSVAGTVYAGTQLGVFKSTNGGVNWKQVYLGMKDPALYMYVNALAIDPGHSNTIYAGTERGVFKSSNAGASWYLTSQNISWVSSLLIDPVDPNTLFAGAGSALYVSSDAGATWRLVTTSQTSGNGLTALAIDPADPATIFGATFGGGVNSITLVDPSTPVATPPAGAYNSAQNVSLAAMSASRIYYTTDGSFPATSATRQTYSGLIPVSASTTLKFCGTGADGICGQPATATYVIDTVAPVTTASVRRATGASPQGVALTCSDGSGSGCAATYYCLGTECTPTTPYPGPLPVSSPTTLRYYSSDAAGNREAIKTATYNPPVADDQAVSAVTGVAQPITLTGSGSDRAALSFVVVTPPAHGSLLGSAPVLQYVSDASYTGTDTFTFKTTDGALDSGSATVTVTVIKNNQSISLAAPVSLTIGSTGTIRAIASSGLLPTLKSQTPGICTVSGASVTGVLPGTCTIVADQLGDASYNPAQQVTSNVIIDKAPLVITADNKTRSYSSANPVLTFSYAGFVNGDTQASLSGAPTLTTAAISPGHPGSYPISVSAGTLASSIYNFKFVDGVLTVKAPVGDGDLNGDSRVDILDVIIALRIAAGLTPATPALLAAGDVSPVDGVIDISDAMAILKKALGSFSWPQ